MQSLASRSRQALTLLSALTLTTILLPAQASAQDYDLQEQPRTFSFSLNHARIGVMVQMQADKENDKLGATIADVTDDGPADKAGLKDGDIITRFNGTSLAGVEADDDDQSGPGMKLVKLAQKLDDGDTVQVEYRRGSDSRKATIVAEEMKGMMSMRRPMTMMRDDMMKTPMPRSFNFEPGNRLFLSEPGSGFTIRTDGFGAFGLDLTDLSPELGEYFGAKSGVLVLRTPKDSSIALKAGDVITAIDGRTPTSEGQVRRILSSYDAGETAKIEILRKQKKMTVSYKVPENQVRWKRSEIRPDYQVTPDNDGKPKVRARTRT